MELSIVTFQMDIVSLWKVGDKFMTPLVDTSIVKSR